MFFVDDLLDQLLDKLALGRMSTLLVDESDLGLVSSGLLVVLVDLPNLVLWCKLEEEVLLVHRLCSPPQNRLKDL